MKRNENDLEEMIKELVILSVLFVVAAIVAVCVIWWVLTRR